MARIDASRPKSRTIGGHFSISIDEHAYLSPGRYGFESARAGLYALLKTLKPRRVFVPNYICSAIPDVLRHAECPIELYSINQNFDVSEQIHAQEDDLIILVNYYGLCEHIIKNCLAEFSNFKVVVDNSQAYFQSAFQCLANIYSPRKFLPVPDGGFVETDLTLYPEPANEQASLARFSYLLKRIGCEPEESRRDYLAAERELDTPTLRNMSKVTQNAVETADLDLIVARRRANYMTLNKLSSINHLQFEIGSQVPICYPLMVEEAERLRNFLIENRVFPPKYWPGIKATNDFERRLLEGTIFLPIDHRYDDRDMNHIIDLVCSYKDLGTL